MAPFQMMVICEMLIKLDTLLERLKKKKGKAKYPLFLAFFIISDKSVFNPTVFYKTRRQIQYSFIQIK